MHRVTPPLPDMQRMFDVAEGAYWDPLRGGGGGGGGVVGGGGGDSE